MHCLNNLRFLELMFKSLSFGLPIANTQTKV